MDRTERLLNLVAFFLDAKDPLTLDDVKDGFPDEYTGTADSIQRKFERDKAELAELGIPLVWSKGSDERPAGYTLDREAYYLPEPGLTAEELAVLYTAGSAALTSGAFPGRQDLAHALRKVGFFADGPIPAAQVRLELGSTADLPARLDALWQAINQRKAIELEYFSPHARAQSRRKVDPYGLALRRGVWNLVGYCHLRKDVRTFHVSRIRDLVPNTRAPSKPDYEIPAGFRVDAHVASWPWQHRMHAPVAVTVQLSGELKPLSAQLFGTAADDSGKVSLEVTFLDGLVTYVMSLGADATVTSPEEAKEKTRALNTRILEAHSR